MKESRFYVAMFGVFMILTSLSIWQVADIAASNGAPTVVAFPVLLIAAGLTAAGILLLYRAAVPGRDLDDEPVEKR